MQDGDLPSYGIEIREEVPGGASADHASWCIKGARSLSTSRVARVRREPGSFRRNCVLLEFGAEQERQQTFLIEHEIRQIVGQAAILLQATLECFVASHQGSLKDTEPAGGGLEGG